MEATELETEQISTESEESAQELNPASLHKIIQLVNEFPGSTASQIASKLGVSPNRINGRMYAMCNSLEPKLKRTMLDGRYRFYAANYKLTSDPFKARPSIPVTIGNEPIYLKKVTAEELDEVERRKKRGKYSEVIDVLEKLEVGEAIFVPREKISEDHLRAVVNKWFREESNGEVTFKIYSEDDYLVFKKLT